MIGAYYKLTLLPDEVRANNKIKSRDRLDCTHYAYGGGSEYSGLTNFVNNKGQLYFYKTACRGFVNTESKRLAEWSLTQNGINFSSIYIENMDCPEFAYGYPNAKRELKNGTPNPLFPFRNDGYLFIINKEYTEIELLIIPDGRNLISSYYQKLIDGGYDLELEKLRANAIPFYNYVRPAMNNLFCNNLAN